MEQAQAAAGDAVLKGVWGVNWRGSHQPKRAGGSICGCRVGVGNGGGNLGKWAAVHESVGKMNGPGSHKHKRAGSRICACWVGGALRWEPKEGSGEARQGRIGACKGGRRGFSFALGDLE